MTAKEDENMVAAKKNPETEEQAAVTAGEQTGAEGADAAARQSQKSLFESEMDRYRAYLERDFETASRYYGFTLFHSLTPEERVTLFREMGFEPQTAEDFYNLGCMAAKEENLAAAKGFFEKTIEIAADFEVAYYNLALTLEKMGDEPSAIEMWEAYVEFLDDDASEALMIAQHVDEMKKSGGASGRRSRKS